MHTAPDYAQSNKTIIIHSTNDTLAQSRQSSKRLLLRIKLIIICCIANEAYRHVLHHAAPNRTHGPLTVLGLTHAHNENAAQRFRRGFKIPHSCVFSSLPRVTIAITPSTRAGLTLGNNGLFAGVVHRCWCDGIQTESHYHNLLISLRDG